MTKSQNLSKKKEEGGRTTFKNDPLPVIPGEVDSARIHVGVDILAHHLLAAAGTRFAVAQPLAGTVGAGLVAGTEGLGGGRRPIGLARRPPVEIDQVVVVDVLPLVEALLLCLVLGFVHPPLFSLLEQVID